MTSQRSDNETGFGVGVQSSACAWLTGLSHDEGDYIVDRDCTLTGRYNRELLKVTVLLQQHNLSLLITENKTPISHPRMTRDVCRQVTKIFGRANLLVDGLEGAIFLLLEVAVDVFACDDDYVLV